ncbi:MAG: hypothetical protein AAF355_00640 [Myxococcota bacterium]
MPPVRISLFLRTEKLNSLAVSIAISLCLIALQGCGDDASGASDSNYDASAETQSGFPSEVAAILAEQCVNCHGSEPRFGAPMSLVTWNDFHAPSISKPNRKTFEVVMDRLRSPVSPMPPPPAVLEESELATLETWIQEGAPAGSALPGPAYRGSGLQDLSCEVTSMLTAHAQDMETEPFHVPVDAGNRYVCFAFSPDDVDGEVLRGVAPIIDDDRVLHHMFLRLQPVPDRQPGDVWNCNGIDGLLTGDILYGWAPGSGNVEYPGELVMPLTDPSGEDLLVLEVHYWNVARYEDAFDASGMALCTGPKESSQQIIETVTLGHIAIDLPPRSTTTVTNNCVPYLAQDKSVQILSTTPHMHELGSSISTVIHRASGEVETLVSIDRWDFNSQAQYPVRIDPIRTGDSLRTTCTFSNTTDRTVTFGEKTEDEMCFNFLSVTPVDLLAAGLFRGAGICIQ